MHTDHPDSPIYRSLQQAVADGYGAYSTLRRYIDKGVLPAVRVGGRIKVKPEDLEALVKPATAPINHDVIPAIERIVAAAPPLTSKDRERLAVVLGGAR